MKWLLVLLAVVLVVQVVYFVRIQSLYPPSGLTTEHFYSPLAVNLLHHGVYGTGEDPDFQLTSKRPPLHSVVLAGVYGIFGEDQRYGLVMNNVFLWLTIVVVYMLGRQISGRVGLAAALFFALDPIIFITANKNQADMFFALLLALFLLQTSRYFVDSANLRGLLASSLLLALATFTRAVSLYMWMPMMIYIIGIHRLPPISFGWRRIVVLAAAFWVIQLIFIGGWMVRNYNALGTLDFASEQAQLFNDFFGPLVVSRATGVSYKEAKIRLADELNNDPEYQGLDKGASERYRLIRGIRMGLDNPLTAAKVYIEHIPVLFINYPVNSVTLFYDEARQDAIGEVFTAYRSEKTSRLDVSGYVDLSRYLKDQGFLFIVAHGAVYKLYYLLLLLGIAAGSVMILLDKRNRSLGLLLIVFIAYMVFSSSFWPTARLRIPIMPAGTIIAAFALLKGWDAFTVRLREFSWIKSRSLFQRRPPPAP